MGLGPHEVSVLHIIHVTGAILLVALNFYAGAGPQETRKRILALSGIAALIVLGTGFRLWQGLYGFAPVGWIIVKIVCWIGLSGLTGVLYRRRSAAPGLLLLVLALAATAVTMVYLKPF
jgi:hypothetical protein